jgi:PhzF family phenazine biosynthesis protein
MSRSRAFAQVDVFTAEPLLGNPVAVVLDAEGLTTQQMQAFTDWTNLSEATFLGPPTRPGADYAVRIFTSGRELPFAGHPTLGTCHAWLAAGGTSRGHVIVQECGVGLVPIRRDAQTGELSFQAPTRTRTGPLADVELDTLVRGLGVAGTDIVDHQWCDNGPPWQSVLLRSAEQVLSLRPDAAILAGRFVGVVGHHPRGADAGFEVRGFFPTVQGLAEDPVTGSLNAALGQWLIGSGQAPDRYVAAQGTVLGRAGRVSVERIGDDVWVGGSCVTVLEGTAEL